MLRTVKQGKYMALWVSTLSLCSCQYIEHKINQLWGQDERPIVDKDPYKLRRAPVGNPRTLSSGMPLMPSMPSDSSFPMNLRPAPVDGNGPVPSFPSQGMSGYMPSPSMPNMPMENVYAPVNTMATMGNGAIENDPIAGESLREMSKEFDEIKGGRFTVNPYAKYREVYATFEPMASDWVVTEEHAVEEFVEKDGTATAQKQASSDEHAWRKQSMFPLNDYAPSAANARWVEPDTKSSPEKTAENNPKQEDLIAVSQPVSSAFEAQASDASPESRASEPSSVDMHVYVPVDADSSAVSYTVTPADKVRQVVVDDYGARVPPQPQKAQDGKAVR